ncbi:caspase family protein [Polynucleobacter rarus]|uniref:caspase family protein n=1 Tax=Polynucleobacter rarus TaxID=556055 RepID=UPI000D3EAF90|nr:caspase family protein [Polynucleobacter rarus]
MKNIISILIFLFLGIGFVFAGDYEDGEREFNKKNYSEAFRLFKLSADQGNSLGQNYLGFMYLRGFGVNQNYAEAYRLFKLSADQGNARGQNSLGVMYSNGIMVPKNEVEAFRLFKLSADQGYAKAQSNLGAMYSNGTIVAKNDAEAFRLYKLSADQGEPYGMIGLGNMYEFGNQLGTGIERNYTKAFQLYKAAESLFAGKDNQGSDVATRNLMYLCGDYQKARYCNQANTGLANNNRFYPDNSKPILESEVHTTNTNSKNQLDLILLQEEKKNEALKKRIDELERSKEEALAIQNKNVTEEIQRLKAEAEVLKKLAQTNNQPKKPINYGKALVAHALVIGNSSYSGGNFIPNPVNDAKAISQKLRSLGFVVTEVTDANRTSMVNSLLNFNKTAANADMTLLFYAGHGMQLSGTNYMLPIDINLQDESQVSFQGVSLNSVVEQYLPGKTKLVFLDACRNNPFMKVSNRGLSRGLAAPINLADGTLISYATKDGSTAEDGNGKNSPFTTALLAHLDDPEDIAVVLRKVRENVLQMTNNKQQPWEYGALTGGTLVLSELRRKN